MSLLAPGLVGDIRPLSEGQQSRLQKNFSTLVRILDSNEGLTAELLAANCITWRHKEAVDCSQIPWALTQCILCDAT